MSFAFAPIQTIKIIRMVIPAKLPKTNCRKGILNQVVGVIMVDYHTADMGVNLLLVLLYEEIESVMPVVAFRITKSG